MVEIKRVLVPYSSEEGKKKLEDYIGEVTGKSVDLGPISYGGKLTLQTMDVDLSNISSTNITCAHYFPGKHFKNVDEFIEWHRNEFGINKEGVEKTEMIAQIPVVGSKDEYRKLVRIMKERGYAIYHGLNDIKDEDHIVAIIIDNYDKSIAQTNVTCMAGWCTAYKALPLCVEEFISNMDILIDDPDPYLYGIMIRRKKEIINEIDSRKDNTHLLIPEGYIKPENIDNQKSPFSARPIVVNRKCRKNS